jgi:Family of unknown function (DUF5985)
MLAAFLSGAFMMALAVIGLIFVRTWRDTGDRFFGVFGVAFWLLALERVPLALFHQMKEPGSFVYLLRLLAFLLIISAVLDKNWIRRA